MKLGKRQILRPHLQTPGATCPAAAAAEPRTGLRRPARHSVPELPSQPRRERNRVHSPVYVLSGCCGLRTHPLAIIERLTANECSSTQIHDAAHHEQLRIRACIVAACSAARAAWAPAVSRASGHSQEQPGPAGPEAIALHLPAAPAATAALAGAHHCCCCCVLWPPSCGSSGTSAAAEQNAWSAVHRVIASRSGASPASCCARGTDGSAAAPLLPCPPPLMPLAQRS